MFRTFLFEEIKQNQTLTYHQKDKQILLVIYEKKIINVDCYQTYF
jgi:hypothetical protein